MQQLLFMWVKWACALEIEDKSKMVQMLYQTVVVSGLFCAAAAGEAAHTLRIQEH